MVRNVVDRAGQQLLQRERAALAVDADALQRLGRQRAEDARQLRPRMFDDRQLFFRIAFVIGQGGRETVLVGADRVAADPRR